jgi:hypothetical protein
MTHVIVADGFHQQAIWWRKINVKMGLLLFWLSVHVTDYVLSMEWWMYPFWTKGISSQVATDEKCWETKNHAIKLYNRESFAFYFVSV